MNILLKVWSDGVENADYALVTIEPAYALRLLEKVKLAQDVKARYGHFHQLTFFECGPVLFGGELEGLEQVDKLEKEERLVLDKPLFIPLDSQARLDCVMLKVTHEEVRWEGYIKHTDLRWETATIPLKMLEEVASVKGEEVQQQPGFYCNLAADAVEEVEEVQRMDVHTTTYSSLAYAKPLYVVYGYNPPHLRETGAFRCGCSLGLNPYLAEHDVVAD